MSAFALGQWVCLVGSQYPRTALVTGWAMVDDDTQELYLSESDVGEAFTAIADDCRPATWAEVEAARGYVPPEVEAHEALCEVVRVAADLWSCGMCCDCSGCKKRNTPECDYRRLTAVFMRLEAAGVEVPEEGALEAGDEQ